MHSVLLVVQSPKNLPTVRMGQWRVQLECLTTTAATIEGCQVLNEGSFLLSLDRASATLATLLRAFDKLEYRLLFFEKEPQWVLPSS